MKLEPFFIKRDGNATNSYYYFILDFMKKNTPNVSKCKTDEYEILCKICKELKELGKNS